MNKIQKNDEFTNIMNTLIKYISNSKFENKDELYSLIVKLIEKI